MARLQALFSSLVFLFASFGVAACQRDAPASPVPTPPKAGPGAVEVSKAPLADAEPIKRGAELYGKMCKVCHGENGEGYKADQAPALANGWFLAAVTDESLHASIAEGRKGTTMSAWSVVRGGPLQPADTQALVKFIRTWQTIIPSPLDEHPVNGDAKRGQKIYDEQCTKCHGVKGVGGPNIHIGDAAWLSHTSNGFLRYAIANGRPPTTMQAYFSSLGPQGIDDLVVTIRGFADPANQNGAGPTPPAPASPPPLPLGPIPLNPKGPEPVGFNAHPGTTPADVIHQQLERKARMGILDARAPSDYTREHIKGAVSVPFYDPAPYLDKLPRDVWLVCYCACPHAESGELAQKLTAAGFKKVTVLDEGLGVWKSKGYGTVEAGAK